MNEQTNEQANTPAGPTPAQPTPAGPTRIYLYRDRTYTPCAFLIVREHADPYSDDPADTRLIDTDWDWPDIADAFGHPDSAPDIGLCWQWLDEHAFTYPGHPPRKLIEDPGYFDCGVSR